VITGGGWEVVSRDACGARLIDGPHLTWRPWRGDPATYVAPDERTWHPVEVVRDVSDWRDRHSSSGLVLRSSPSVAVTHEAEVRVVLERPLTRDDKISLTSIEKVLLSLFVVTVTVTVAAVCLLHYYRPETP
jgi:hypothetical protein